MEVIGKLNKFLPEQRGETQRGPWVRGGFVIETEEQYPRKIAFSVWGEDKWTAIKLLPLGNTIKVTFSIESREYNERWYTDCRCTQVDIFTAATSPNTYNQAYGNAVNQQSGQTNYGANQPSEPYQQPPQNVPTQQEQMPQASQGGTIEKDAMEAGDAPDDLPF